MAATRDADVFDTSSLNCSVYFGAGREENRLIAFDANPPGIVHSRREVDDVRIVWIREIVVWRRADEHERRQVVRLDDQIARVS